MSEPLVSILIPCHNAARWLGATLESALAQTWPRTEIIVVNDGSTDDSAAIARGFASRDVRVIDQPNSGPGAALNRGLRESTGDYVKFLDADDLISSNSIAIQLAALRASGPREIAVGEWARFRDDPSEACFEPRAGWHDGAPVDWIVETWEDGEPMYQNAMFLIPRALLDAAGGWDESLTLINDHEFYTRLVLASDGVRFTPGARLFYRSGIAGSISKRTSRAACESAKRSVLLSAGHLLKAEDSPRTRRAAARMIRNIVYSFYPAHTDLADELEREVARLGGTDLKPQGGVAFRAIASVAGWRTALRMRRRLQPTN
ncbi:MAG TPA: glycosyltransferase family A protein [Opitutaceae bacterium]|nr:glycosyltransferase family A protein [Opitutaceae bacterium]